MSDKNLSIWKQVDETAPGYTKASELNGRIVTSINGTYMVKRATEIFGPIGKGWGYEITEERFDQGGPIIHNGNVLGNSIMHTIKLTLWYLDDEGERREVSHFGHTPYVLGTHYGAMTDFDAPKKSLTDAIKKCLSMLGFSADVYLGLFDDQTYVEAARVKESVKKADDADAELIKQRQEFGEWAEGELKAYGQIPNKAALRTVHQGHLKKIARQCQVLGIDQEKAKKPFVDAFQARMDEIAPDVDLVCADCGVVGKGKPDSKCPECGGKRSPE